MRVRIQRWGNSLALRIPKPFARDTNLEEGGLVDVSVSEGRLLVVKGKKNAPTLEDLVAGITEENRYPETSWGPPVGNEVW